MMGHTMIAIMTTGIGATLGNFGGGMLQDTFGITGLHIFTCSMTLLGTFIILMVKFKTKLKQD